jgi:hypothetical protein
MLVGVSILSSKQIVIESVIATTTASSTYTEPNQYIGQDYDPESTLSYLNARYYDSGVV